MDPVSHAQLSLVNNPFPQHVQAFLRDFKTSEPVGIIDLDRKVFGAPLRRDILQRVVVWQRDSMRQGTQSAKTRSEVTGSGKKKAPQKGRGKARVGDMKAPHMRGGKVERMNLLVDHNGYLYTFKKVVLLLLPNQEIILQTCLVRCKNLVYVLL